MGWGGKTVPIWARILLRILMEASPFKFPMLEEYIQMFSDGVTNIHHFRNLLMDTSVRTPRFFSNGKTHALYHKHWY